MLLLAETLLLPINILCQCRFLCNLLIPLPSNKRIPGKIHLVVKEQPTLTLLKYGNTICIEV